MPLNQVILCGYENHCPGAVDHFSSKRSWFMDIYWLDMLSGKVIIQYLNILESADAVVCVIPSFFGVTTTLAITDLFM